MVCLGIVLVLRKGPVKRGDGLIVLSELCKRETFLVQGVCIIGAYLQRMFVSRNRFTEPPEVGIGQPLLERGRGASGIKGKGLFERLDRFLEPAQFCMGESRVIERSCMILPDAQALVEGIQCILVPAQVDAGNTFLVPCIRILR